MLAKVVRSMVWLNEMTELPILQEYLILMTKQPLPSEEKGSVDCTSEENENGYGEKNNVLSFEHRK